MIQEEGNLKTVIPFTKAYTISRMKQMTKMITLSRKDITHRTIFETLPATSPDSPEGSLTDCPPVFRLSSIPEH
jgi:hypothetical protein